MGKYKKVQEISLYPEQTMATAIFQPVQLNKINPYATQQTHNSHEKFTYNFLANIFPKLFNFRYNRIFVWSEKWTPQICKIKRFEALREKKYFRLAAAHNKRQTCIELNERMDALALYCAH